MTRVERVFPNCPKCVYTRGWGGDAGRRKLNTNEFALLLNLIEFFLLLVRLKNVTKFEYLQRVFCVLLFLFPFLFKDFLSLLSFGNFTFGEAGRGGGKCNYFYAEHKKGLILDKPLHNTPD